MGYSVSSICKEQDGMPDDVEKNRILSDKRMRQKVYSIGIRQLVYRRSSIESESKTFHVLVVDLRHVEIKERYDRRFFKRNSNV